MNISVAMCTYNGERYLLEQLQSIAAQTRLPDELVVSDDQSTDSSLDIIAAFQASASFPVHLQINPSNVGSTRNFEQAIARCEGDIIALCDQDDVWLPTKLQRMAECFLREPAVGLMFSDAEVVDEELHPLGYRLWESVGFDDAHRHMVRTGRVLDVLLPGWTVTGATMAFRSRFRNLVLDIPTNLALIHDGWIALMIALVADVSFTEEPLIKYRQHARQQIGAKERKASAGSRVALGDVKRAMQRKNSYEEMIEIGSRARHRLLEQGNQYQTADALCRLEARLTHLTARAHLPQGKLSRARCVIGELLSRRYHLYSNGFRSAVKDLLA